MFLCKTYIMVGSRQLILADSEDITNLPSDLTVDVTVQAVLQCAMVVVLCFRVAVLQCVMVVVLCFRVAVLQCVMVVMLCYVSVLVCVLFLLTHCLEGSVLVKAQPQVVVRVRQRHRRAQR